jgi:hypothetical protein
MTGTTADVNRSNQSISFQENIITQSLDDTTKISRSFK